MLIQFSFSEEFYEIRLTIFCSILYCNTLFVMLCFVNRFEKLFYVITCFVGMITLRVSNHQFRYVNFMRFGTMPDKILPCFKWLMPTTTFVPLFTLFIMAFMFDRVILFFHIIRFVTTHGLSIRLVLIIY